MIAEYLDKIRNSDDETKKKWLIFFSTVSMIVIVSLWVWYMQVFVSNSVRYQVGEREPDEVAVSGFLGVGFAEAAQKAKNLTGGLFHAVKKGIPEIGAKKTIIIENKDK